MEQVIYLCDVCGKKLHTDGSDGTLDVETQVIVYKDRTQTNSTARVEHRELDLCETCLFRCTNLKEIDGKFEFKDKEWEEDK